jgi:MoaA/NifB/PqqE/SkfB family radical SAM enzyme
MNAHDFFVAWGRILSGTLPLLSIEITRECPLHCPGCYAYGDSHLGGDVTLRDLHDHRGNQLVQGIISIVRRYKPMHVSLVGGEPMMRHRELSQVLPMLSKMGVWSMVVTSGVIPIPQDWSSLPRTTIAVSVDGLPQHHDIRRAPATYDRILKNIAASKVNIHLTVTQPMLEHEDYLDAYFDFWSNRPEVYQIWMSTYTPQVGESSPEMLTADSRQWLVSQIDRWRQHFPKLLLDSRMAHSFMHPPQSPAECTFARMSVNYTADLQTRVQPCIFGGNPDCSQCGCAISVALHGVQNIKIKKSRLTVGHLVRGSMAIGRATNRLRPKLGRAERWGDIIPQNPSQLVSINSGEQADGRAKSA